MFWWPLIPRRPFSSRLSKSYSRAAAVLVDEFHACRLQRLTNDDQSGPAGLNKSGFQLANRDYPYLRLSCEVLLAPDEFGSEGHDALPTCHVELDVARRFLRLADLGNGVFERLGRYEAAIWRQVRQTLFTLEALRWRTSHSRKWQRQHSWQLSD
jgi:hypothetical protein